jgi:hypothetical protein
MRRTSDDAWYRGMEPRRSCLVSPEYASKSNLAMCPSEMETTIQYLDVEKYITSFLSHSLDPPLRILIPKPSKQEPTQNSNSNKNKQL